MHIEYIELSIEVIKLITAIVILLATILKILNKR